MDREARIDALQGALAENTPRLVDTTASVHRAAVALVLRSTGKGIDLLLIQRPESPTDPWSGHMAFPGGRRTPGESDQDTAERETREEVGLALGTDGRLIGRLDDVRPVRGGPQIAVAAFVFAVDEGAVVRPDPREVADVFWIPLAHLASPAAAAEYLHTIPGGEHARFAAVSYEGKIIWGLTYRMLMQFLEIARTLPDEVLNP